MYLELGGIKGATPKSICNPLQISDCIWRWPLERLKHVKAEYLDVRCTKTTNMSLEVLFETNDQPIEMKDQSTCTMFRPTHDLVYAWPDGVDLQVSHTVGRVWGACWDADASAFSPFGQRILIFGCMTARRCARCSLEVFQLLWPACYEGRPDVLQAVQCNGV